MSDLENTTYDEEMLEEEQQQEESYDDSDENQTEEAPQKRGRGRPKREETLAMRAKTRIPFDAMDRGITEVKGMNPNYKYMWVLDDNGNGIRL